MNDIVKQAQGYVIRDRSDYQLKHFVIGQHDTPEMRFRQILLEARDLLMKIKTAEIDLELLQMKIEDLEKTGDKKDELKAKKQRLHKSLVESLLVATKQELDYLVELSKDYRHYTQDEIEANQAEYWDLRLTRQALNDRMALEQGVNVGNLESLRQIGALQREITV